MKLLTFTEVSRQLGVSLPTARKIRAQLPGAVLIGTRIRYREDAILEFVQRGGCRPVEFPSTIATA
jgi:hypothetical protein